MNLKDLYNKLFISGDWQMAYRQHNEHWPFDYSEKFIPIPNNKKYWYADPMLFEDSDKTYLFCEAFNKKEQKGELAVMEWKDKMWTKPEIIVSNNYHMSYPCVFKYDKTYYMIPESAECGNLELYIADEFPYKWHKECNIIKDVKLADPTVFIYDNKFILFAWDESERKYRNHIYEINMCQKSCNEIMTLCYDANNGRPAGYVITSGDRLIRPAQDSTEMYGRTIIWREFDDNWKVDNILGKINSDSVKIENVKGGKRVHTFSVTSNIEIIDFCVFRFDLLKRFKILNRIYKLNKRLKSMHNA